MTRRKVKDKGRHDTDARNIVGVSKKIEELTGTQQTKTESVPSGEKHDRIGR